MFIIQSRASKIYFLVFKMSVPEYDNQFINKFHQICCIKLPEFRGHVLMKTTEKPYIRSNF